MASCPSLVFKEQAVDVVFGSWASEGYDTTNVVTGEMQWFRLVSITRKTLEGNAHKRQGAPGKKAGGSSWIYAASCFKSWKAKQLDVDLHAFQKDGLDRFWNLNVDLVSAFSAWWVTNGKMLQLWDLFLMEGLDQEVDMDRVKHALVRNVVAGRSEAPTLQVYLDGAHWAMLRLIEFASRKAREDFI